MKCTPWFMMIGSLLSLNMTPWAQPPPSRWGHTMVEIDGNIYIFGGEANESGS